MKLNDFKLVENTIKEADSSYFIGDLGKAMAQQANARFNPFSKGGNPELSVQDKMTSNIYVKDFVGRAKEALKRGIDGKQIDPNPNAGSTPVQGPTPPSPVDNKQPPPSPVDNKQTAPAELTPAQIRQQKQMSAAKTAQDQMAKNPVPTKTTQTTQPPFMPVAVTVLYKQANPGDNTLNLPTPDGAQIGMDVIIGTGSNGLITYTTDNINWTKQSYSYGTNATLPAGFTYVAPTPPAG